MDRIDFPQDTSVLVTGGTGFIGSYLVDRLARAGARLSLIVRPGGPRSRQAGRPGPPERARLFEADIRDLDAVLKAVKTAQPEWIFHLAAVTDVKRDPALEAPCRDVNFEGTVNLAEALKRTRFRRLIHLGTCEEYGRACAPFSEDMPVDPRSPYSESKAAATQALVGMARTERFPVVILRPFLTYGPGQAPTRFVAQAVENALAGRSLPMTPGEQTREFNPVEDIVGGILKAALVPDIEGEIINLACEEEWPLEKVARMIYRIAGNGGTPDLGALPYREGETMRFYGSSEKCRRLLGYRPAVSLEDGLGSLIEWERDRMKGGAGG